MPIKAESLSQLLLSVIVPLLDNNVDPLIFAELTPLKALSKTPSIPIKVTLELVGVTVEELNRLIVPSLTALVVSLTALTRLACIPTIVPLNALFSPVIVAPASLDTDAPVSAYIPIMRVFDVPET